MGRLIEPWMSTVPSIPLLRSYASSTHEHANKMMAAAESGFSTTDDFVRNIILDLLLEILRKYNSYIKISSIKFLN